jgi:hypothetical protein
MKPAIQAGWHRLRICEVIHPPIPGAGEHVSEIVQFVPKSELERARLIREARAIYDSIFPPAAPGRAPQGEDERVKT